jgi:hypothetical protein
MVHAVRDRETRVEMTLSRKRLVVAALALPVGLILGALIAVLTPAASSTTGSPAAHQVVSSTEPTTTSSTVATSQPTVNPTPTTGTGLGCNPHPRHPPHRDRLASTTTTTANPESQPVTKHCPPAGNTDALNAGKPTRDDSDNLGP